MLLQTLRQLRASDGGPIYVETDFSRWIVEPWNAISAALFIVIVVYWIRKVIYQPENQGFIKLNLPFLAIGGIGGTIYHAFRYSQVFLVMDWLPILLLCLSTSLYFCYKLIGKWLPAIGIIFIAFLLQGLIMNIVPPSIAINVNYAFMAGLILLPVLLYAYKNKFYMVRWIGLAISGFAIALFFRVVDSFVLLPMGTHFLWHIFGALSCHFMIVYIFEINKRPPAKFISV